MFQQAVLNTYLADITDEDIHEPWDQFASLFLNPEIQQNIRRSKEEEYQDGFLTDLFVNVLGYTKYPASGYNLRVEQKDEKGSKKADGALLKDDNVVGVIELKGTETTDLDKVESQAFGYKNYHRHAEYVIISNFEKLRFYIDNAVEFREFNLFELTKEEFKVLWLCLEQNNFKKGLPKKIKEASLTQNEEVTQKLYADYSAFKDAIFKSIVEHNPDYDKLRLFKKTQKLLDRFLFIFFAEDQQLLPPNSIRRIIQQWKELREEYDVDVTLYERFKKYFGYLNTGHKGKEHEIFPYNGGLFADDEVLDNISIEDELLYEHASELSLYDFASEVDVNILGHIFEHSLNEIEEITAELEGQDVDKSKSRRKKDGVFYTPKYITQYIVENTVGKLCGEKKTDLDIEDEQYTPNRQKATKKKLLKKLDAYRDWLLSLTICDPACGSGAFLNQALEFLMEEHHYIDELQAKLLEESIVYPDVEASILENNLFGVDINEESVEIAKLSLWLRTAQKGRKLTSLNNNIKCGNSLIDDPEVAGDQAFDWEVEFPTVFKNGGFDVVIGNPPYVRQELFGEIKPYLEGNFKVFEGTSDLFAYFYEKSFLLLKDQGVFGFISNTFDKTKAANKLRKHLSKQTTFEKYVDFTEVQVFEGATTYPIILTARNKRTRNNQFTYIKIPKKSQSKAIDIESQIHTTVDQSSLNPVNWDFNSVKEIKVLEKLKKHEKIEEQFGKTYRGIVTGYNEAFIIDGKTKAKLEKEHATSNELIKPLFEGKDLSKWLTPDTDKYIIFTRRGTEIDKYPAVKKYLEQYKERLTPRNSPEIKVGRKPGPYEWHEIQDAVDYYEEFEKPKLTWPNLQATNKFCLDEKEYYINAPSVVLPVGNKTLLCICNSSLIWFFLKSICVVRSGGYIEVKPQYFEQIPIPELNNEDEFEVKADQIIELTKKLQTVQENLHKLLLSKFDIEKLSRKLQSWHELTFKQFLKELKKKKVKLSLSEEAEWMEYFNEQKTKADELKTQIAQADAEIDKMVYELYGLSEEEVKVVENID